MSKKSTVDTLRPGEAAISPSSAQAREIVRSAKQHIKLAKAQLKRARDELKAAKRVRKQAEKAVRLAKQPAAIESEKKPSAIKNASRRPDTVKPASAGTGKQTRVGAEKSAKTARSGPVRTNVRAATNAQSVSQRDALAPAKRPKPRQAGVDGAALPAKTPPPKQSARAASPTVRRSRARKATNAGPLSLPPLQPIAAPSPPDSDSAAAPAADELA